MHVTKSDVQKRKKLGTFGENLAPDLLARAGFINIKSLNQLKHNHEFADFYAERGGKKFIISVKARNKWELPNRSNPLPHYNNRYKFGDPAKKYPKHAFDVANRYDATAAWLAIAFERLTYDAYFWTVQQLLDIGRDGRGIPMTPKYTKLYECIVVDELHHYDYEEFRNLPAGIETPNPTINSRS
ncbi:MAG: hypothetical protein HY607_04395 [Planctomycetes bacterium]|uniref:hypothetical protein n=1 Tax=Candidatus Wunengus californicus TaxID=3367619 RepID=UPI0040257F64|nr:hypothetical protein [Planctomycetota bacterium]MBI4221906.1 hypothetical protein [Planctomycetota bacterium]